MQVCHLSAGGGTPPLHGKVLSLSCKAPADLSGIRRSMDGHDAKVGAGGQGT